MIGAARADRMPTIARQGHSAERIKACLLRIGGRLFYLQRRVLLVAVAVQVLDDEAKDVLSWGGI